MNPILSVVVPIYNAEEKLDRCIQSILSQTYDNFELILIDDGSIDKSAFICDKYALNDKRIVVKHIPNSGVSTARNLGIDLSRGQYLMFVDSDDYIEKDMFMTYIQNIEKTHSDVVIGSVQKMNQNQLSVFKCFEDELLYPLKFWNTICQDNSVFGYVWGKLLSLDIIKKNSLYFDASMYSQEDLNFMLSYYDSCQSFSTISYKGYIYDYLESSRIAPFFDFINNQLKLYFISKSHAILSKISIDQISNRINIFIYYYLYSSENRNVFINHIKKLSGSEKLKQFLLDNCIDKKERSLYLFSQSRYTQLYLYIIVNKLIRRIKKFIKGDLRINVF